MTSFPPSSFMKKSTSTVWSSADLKSVQAKYVFSSVGCSGCSCATAKPSDTTAANSKITIRFMASSPIGMPQEYQDPGALICELARSFYGLGWVSGTGGGICLRDGDRVVVAPSGVQKERMRPEQMFAIGLDGALLARPDDPALRPSECS